MREPKKRIAVIMLISVYALLMFSEITVNTVLCYKENGQFDLEMVVLDFICACPESPDNHQHHAENDDSHPHDHQYADHDHDHDHETDRLPRMQKTCRHCFDIPFDGSWLERVNPTSTAVDLSAKTVLFQPHLPTMNGIQGTEDGFLQLKPLTKFLVPPPALTGTTVLRC